ncbi:hypothetical protein ACIRRA_17640 [Nocardia sp. NPDC101769]|uniref:hypothetical protein n=1 Tax=Nocardia sp. NPDC101769 TaxID=3364333 RepID=UPI00382170B4
MASRSRRPTTSRIERVYRTAGLVMGGLWALQHGHSITEHALRFGVLLFVVAPIVSALLKRRARAKGLPGLPISPARLMTAKAVLLVVALAVTWWLDRCGVHATDYIVAGGITATVAMLGPRLHNLLMLDHGAPTSNADSPSTQRRPDTQAAATTPHSRADR